jgi:hypothetical protein
MKKQFFRFGFTGLLMCTMFQLSAQVSISTSATPADNSAMLEIKSQTKGVLIPRISMAQMEAVVNPANGLLVFCITDNKFYTYIAAENAWRDMVYGSDSITIAGQNAPVTIAPSIQASPGTTIGIPVKVTGFNNIGSFSLTLQFNYPALTYSSYTNNSGFPGFACDNFGGTGTLVISGNSSGDAITLPDNATVFTINFLYNGGTIPLTWFDNGESCRYTGPAPGYTVLPDTPQSSFYLNGSVSLSAWP